MSSCRISAAVTIALAFISTDSRAAVVDLTTSGGPGAAHVIGFKSDALTSNLSSFQVGRVLSRNGVPTTFRTFFTFDLSGVVGSVTAAELRMFNGAVLTPDATETISLYDVSTSASQLISTTVTSEIFADLGTGVQYGGNAEFSNTVATTIRAFSLNSAALSAINANRGSKFSMGASMETLASSPVNNEVAYAASSSSENATLRLTIVPEPTVFAIGLPALMGVTMLRRRAIA